MTEGTKPRYPLMRLAAEVERLECELRDMRKLLDEAQVAESGICLGDIVRGKQGSRFSEKLFRVSRIEARYNPPWLHGNPQRADGSFGTAERGLFGYWERVT